MCSRTTCMTCNKPTWSGCGAHVEQALRGVPVESRCRCREDGARAPSTSLSDRLSTIFGIRDRR